MKKLFVVAVALLVAFGVQAQNRPQKDNKSPEDRAKMMTKHLDEALNLSDEQEKNILAINISTNKELESLRKQAQEAKKNETFEPEAFKEKVKAVQDKRKSDVNAQLNKEQQEKLEKMMERRERGGKGRMREEQE